MTIEQAETRFAGKVMFPQHRLASRATATAWHCGDLVLAFESGLRLHIGPSEIGDPAAYFAAAAERSGGRITTGTLFGFPAQFTDPDAAGARTAGGVWFVRNGWNYILAGRGTSSLDELRDVARTLRDG